ncbi:MAG TPA: serine hydrolase domain-containing protein [Trebonia sp.]
MEGWIHPDFGAVEQVFDRQLRHTEGGAALSVYHRGELVADLWGGTRTTAGDPWERDTLVMCFSATKGVTSTALHVLAERGQLDYDAPVASYWPEFAQAGKEHITVRHVLTHSAGLHSIRALVDGAYRMLDWDYMVDALARAKPAYPPGTRHGYHGLTYGWLAGELIRRVSGRSIAQFVDDELARPLGLDGLYVGCPPEQRGRIAPLAPLASPIGRLVDKPGGRFPVIIRFPVTSQGRRLVDALLPSGVEDVMWSAGVMDAAIPSANGFVTARSLATLYAMLAGGGEINGVRLLSRSTVEQINVVHSHGPDYVLVLPMAWRLGYHQAFTSRGVLRGAFGHFGLGGSGGWADPQRDLALAMVCSRGTGTPMGDRRIGQLGTAVVHAADRRAAPRSWQPIAS